MEERFVKVADDVMRAAQLAAALEVSGYPKPGNVHRTADFEDTSFEQFIAGSIALGPAIRDATLRGMMAGLGEIKVSHIGIGKYVKQAVHDVNLWHGGGNTHLGISLLFVPLAAAAGLTFAMIGRIEPRQLQESVRRVTESTTPQDASDAYDAIIMASSAALGQLEDRKAPDLMDVKAKDKIVERNVSLYEAMKASSSWDNIAREWSTGMEISFEVGYPTFLKAYHETGDVNIATTHTFLTILSRFRDTFIARKIGVKTTTDIPKAVRIGLNKSKEVSEMAARVLELGGLRTEEGREALFRFDEDLRRSGNDLNPGTTADLTAASLMIAILCGFRP